MSRNSYSTVPNAARSLHARGDAAALAAASPEAFRVLARHGSGPKVDGALRHFCYLSSATDPDCAHTDLMVAVA